MAKRDFDYDSYDVWLDVRCQRNRHERFAPAGITLQGEYRSIDDPNASNALTQVTGGVIPGHRVLVDTKQRHVKIVHRMSLPENKAKLAQIETLRGTDEFLNMPKFKFEDVDSSPSEQEWPTWLWQMHRGVENGTLHIARGKLPTGDEIRRMGDITRVTNGFFGGGDQAKQFYMLPKIVDKPQPATAGKP